MGRELESLAEAGTAFPVVFALRAEQDCRSACGDGRSAPSHRWQGSQGDGLGLLGTCGLEQVTAHLQQRGLESSGGEGMGGEGLEACVRAEVRTLLCWT